MLSRPSKLEWRWVNRSFIASGSVRCLSGSRTTSGNRRCPSRTSPTRREPTAARQLEKLKAIRKLNGLKRRHLSPESPRQDSITTQDSRIEAAIANYEMAFRMQAAVPELMDLSGETAETCQLYGIDEPATKLFGTRCLLARRLVERGVRFIEVFPPKVNWPSG